MLPPDERRCIRRSKRTGDRCGAWSAPGQKVCRWHGAESPQAKRAARLRLAAAFDPALERLLSIINTDPAQWTEIAEGVWKPVGVSHADHLRAFEAVADRVGFPRRTELDVVDARARLEARLRERLERTDEESS